MLWSTNRWRCRAARRSRNVQSHKSDCSSTRLVCCSDALRFEEPELLLLLLGGWWRPIAVVGAVQVPDSDRSSNPRWAHTCSNSATLSDSTWARVGIHGNQVGGVTGVDQPLAKNSSDEDTGDDRERVVVVVVVVVEVEVAALKLRVGSAREHVPNEDEVAAFDQEEESEER